MLISSGRYAELSKRQEGDGGCYIVREIGLEDMMILFRADGNPQVGSGHIMRCLSLADAFRDMGHASVFVTADDCFQETIQKRGYRSVVLHTKYDRMEDELPVLLPILQENRPRCVLLDSYFVTPAYMTAIRAEVPLAYIDDLNLFDYPADLVVNYMLYAGRLGYPQNKSYLLGSRYAPLRKEFQDVPQRRTAVQVKNVLLSTGGSDGEHVALRCVQYLRERQVNGVTYHVILGAMNQDTAEIERLADGCAHIVPHRNVSDMRSLMLQCDAAISAGGTTLFELCACGLPTVTYVLADNQIMNAAAFEEAGLTLCVGDIRNDSRFAAHMFERLETLMQDHSLRRRMSERMQALVDGDGAIRLAEAILRFARD